MKKFLIPIIFLFLSCTTSKNTFITRNYHNLTSYYNVYFNGKESFNSGLIKIENQYKENLSNDLIPVFKYYYSDATKLAASDMDKTLLKMSKTIANHSITVKPKIRGKITPRDKEFLKKNEYVLWIDDAYLLIGKANFYKNNYDKSLNSFRYIVNTFQKNDNTYYDAKLWIAKTYLKQNRNKDAFSYLSELQNDIKFPRRLHNELSLTLVDYYISTNDLKNALNTLSTTIPKIKNKYQKSRLLYLLAQLYVKSENFEQAIKIYRKIIQLNADYDIVISSKIQLAVYSNDKNKDLKKELFKLLKDNKNEEYKDQIYYALATIEFNEKNISKAIEYYKLSSATSKSNKNQKIQSMLALANVYFDNKKYYESAIYYDSLMTIIPEDYKEKNHIIAKAQNITLLAFNINQIKVQDSLQFIANLPENTRNKIIDSIINSIVEKEKFKDNSFQQEFDPLDINNNSNTPETKNTWYMYNSVLVSRGQQDFKKKWGNRKLEDNWRRANKTSPFNFDTEKKQNQYNDTNVVSDNKKREYYLQNLPLTKEKKQKSDSIIQSYYYNIGIIYSNNLNEYELSNSAFEELLQRYPKTYLRPDVYFNLYQNYLKVNNFQKANYYKELLIIQYPESNYARYVQNPDFFLSVVNTEKNALNLYDSIVLLYNKNNYIQALNLCNKGLVNFPYNSITPYFYFYKAKAYGNLDKRDSMFYYFNYILKNYPNTQISSITKEILELSTNKKYDFNIYKNNFYEPHLIVFIIPKRENTSELRFFIKNEVELFFTNKNFQIDTLTFDERLSMITLKTFDNKEEATRFYNYIVVKPNVKLLLNSSYFFIFSSSNFATFLNDKFIEKYEIYFNQNYIK